MEVEWIILADAADVVNNKLYLMGGGWDTFYVNSGFPVQQRVAVAVAFKVPWNQTNQLHEIEIEFADQDGNVIGKIGGHVEVGRPAGIPAGQSQRFQVAATIDLMFQGPGTVVITPKVEGQAAEGVSFNVVPGPMLAMRGQMAGDGGNG